MFKAIGRFVNNERFTPVTRTAKTPKEAAVLCLNAFEDFAGVLKIEVWDAPEPPMNCVLLVEGEVEMLERLLKA